MELEVFVMPLHRFLMGDYTTALENFVGVGNVTMLGIDGKPIQRVAADARLAEAKARNAINRIKRSVERDNPGAVVDWRDEGDIVHSRQASFMVLRTFARWIDCQKDIPEFDPPPAHDYYKHPVWQIQPPSLTFPHLVNHSCYSGYLLPVAFENLARGDSYTIANRWTFFHAIGSSYTMLREIDGLREFAHPPAIMTNPFDRSATGTGLE